VNGAYASFEENLKGKIKEGFLGDIVLLDKDITSIDPKDIWNCKVIATFVGGKLVYDSRSK
jgi:predicted amidohydrolase YtcJ